MKKITIYFVLLLVVCIGQNLKAQTKIAFFDLQKVLPQLPDYKQAQTDIQTYAKQIQEELKSKQLEFETKYKEYQEKAETLTPVLKASKEKELQTLQQQYQAFEQKVQVDVQNREGQLLTPIYEKIEKAINEIAASSSFDYVVRAEACAATVKNNDISGLVLKKLGVN